MAANNGAGMVRSGSSSLVDGLALSVISRVNAAPHQRRNRRIDVGTNILLSETVGSQSFDQDAVLSDLASLRISATDIVDHCIPTAARELGRAWNEDRMTWAQVTVGSVRLFNLCKSVGMAWDNVRPPMNARSILLATIDGENHILGPAVLADQLRRRGHSVQLHSNGTANSLAAKLSSGPYDGLLISVSSDRTLESAVRAIKKMRSAGVGAPVILGGMVLSLEGRKVENTGADLVTNNIEDALDAISGNDISLRVAE